MIFISGVNNGFKAGFNDISSPTVWKVIEGFRRDEVKSRVLLTQAGKGRRPAKRQRTQTNSRNAILVNHCHAIREELSLKESTKTKAEIVGDFLQKVASLFIDIANEEAKKRKDKLK